MNILYAPWRQPYTDQVTAEKHNGGDQRDCIFCIQLATNDDEKYLILRRFDHTFVVMNKYPYNAGHVLVLPLAHLQTLEQLSIEAATEFMEVTRAATGALQEILKNAGTNIGLNLGKASGAGIPGHLHMHIVPRWQGDTNFMVTVADTKQVSADILKLYHKLKPAFAALTLRSPL